MTNILLVEDDQSLGATLKERLEKERYQVYWARTLAEASKAILAGDYRLVLLDVNLPDGSGFDFAKEIKSKGCIPIIFLTAMSSAEDRLKGFELGGDDFVPKPFHLKELLLRIQKVIDIPQIERRVTTGEISVDFDSMAVTFPDGSTERPTTRDFKLLQLLIQSSPNVVSRESVMKHIFPTTSSEDDLPTQRTIDNSILRLRQMLRRVAGEYIRSVRGIGYQWIPPSS